MEPAEAEQLWDSQTLSGSWQEERSAPVTQRRYKAILPELVPAKGLAVIHDRALGHDVLVLRRDQQHASLSRVLDVSCSQTTPFRKFEVGRHVLQLGVVFDLPPLL